MSIEDNNIDNMLQYLDSNPDFLGDPKYIGKLREMLYELRTLREAELARATIPIWGPPGQGDITPDELFGDFEVVLVAVGLRRIQVIKTLREITGCGLQESKEMIEFGSGVGPIIKRCALEEAQEIRDRLAAAGALAIINPYDGKKLNELGVFDVILTDVGPNKIQVIKTIREQTGLGLKESKEMTDEVRFHTHWTTQQLYERATFVRRGLKKPEAEKLRAVLTEAGAKVLLIDGHGQRWVRLECER